jgi:hypothetical protein
VTGRSGGPTSLLNSPLNEGTIEELTKSVLAYLRVLRTERGSGWKGHLYQVYVVLLLVLVYVVPYTASAQRSAGGDLAPLLPHAPGTALCVVVLGYAVLAQLAAADGRYRGPMVVDPPTMDWLLATPVSRSVVLRAYWRVSLVRWTAGGAGMALVLAFAVRVGPSTRLDLGELLLAASAGAAFGAGCAAVSGAFQLHGDSPPMRRLMVAIWIVTGAGSTGCLLAAGGADVAPLATVLSWAGPVGWTAQLTVTTADPGSLGRSAAGLLLVTVAAAGTLAVDRSLPAIRSSLLRTRVERLRSMSAAVYSLDFRLVRLIATGTPHSGRSVRIPPPQRTRWALSWRILLGWCRRPAAVLIGLGVVLGSGWLTMSGPAGASTASLVVALVVAAAGYVGASSLIEAVRVEADDVMRSRGLPYRFRDLLTRLLGPPIALAVAGGGVLCGIVAVLDSGAVKPVLIVIAALPACCAAATVSACRGQFPVHLLLGVDTPAGNTGPVQAALWLLRAPLTVIALMIPAVWWARDWGHPGSWEWLAMLPTTSIAGYLVVVTTLMLLWARHRADLLYRGAR